MSHRPPGPRRVVRPAVLLAAAVLLAVAVVALVLLRSEGPPPKPVPIAETSDPWAAPPLRTLQASLRRRLEEDCGVRLTRGELALLALQAQKPVRARLEALAAELGVENGSPKGPDWRRAFSPLRGDRPEGVEATLEAYRREVAAARDFLEERDLVSLPPAPPEVLELKNPRLKEIFSLAMYLDDSLAVPVGDAPERHCHACIVPLAVHETYPGHHVAFAAAPHEKPRNLCFHEGWGQYAELLMLEQGYYDGEPARELAAWRLVLLRLERALIDARLAIGDLPPEEAVHHYRRNLVLDPEAAEAEALTPEPFMV